MIATFFTMMQRSIGGDNFCGNRLDIVQSPTTCNLSANLIQMRLTQYDHGEMEVEEAAAAAIAEYDAKVAASERKFTVEDLQSC